MTRELTLTDIAGYLPHKLQLFFSHYGEIETANIWNLQGAILTNFKPVLRPMSDLYVEITDKDYNNGNPFVPLVELAKARHPNFDHYNFYATEQLVFCSIDSDFDNYTECYDYYGDRLSFAEFDLLHRLHFDYRGLIDAGLAVSVHDLKRNPYEAANN
jgi:hypothetical protein